MVATPNAVVLLLQVAFFVRFVLDFLILCNESVCFAQKLVNHVVNLTF